MSLTVKHSFTSPKSDGPDSTLIRPSNWNADHTLTGFPGDATKFLNGAGAFTTPAGGGGSITSPQSSEIVWSSSQTWQGHNAMGAQGTVDYFDSSVLSVVEDFASDSDEV